MRQQRLYSVGLAIEAAFANTMARLWLVLVLSAAACLAHVEATTEKKPDYAAIIKSVQTSGAALPAQFSSQWTKVLAGQRKRVLAVQSRLLKKESAAATKTALSQAFSDLNRSLAQVDTQFDAYNKQQGTEIQQLVQQYVAVLQQRVKATGAEATNQEPVLQLRRNKMNMLKAWENRILEVNSKYRSAYRSSLGAAVKAAASTVQKALGAAFTTLLEETIVDQEENITTLARTQFPLVEKFALLAGKNLLELLVAAQAALL